MTERLRFDFIGDDCSRLDRFEAVLDEHDDLSKSDLYYA
jgi:hypothetical protein